MAGINNCLRIHNSAAKLLNGTLLEKGKNITTPKESLNTKIQKLFKWVKTVLVFICKVQKNWWSKIFYKKQQLEHTNVKVAQNGLFQYENI